jgi:uncharacterized damage-inducible protein DinB
MQVSFRDLVDYTAWQRRKWQQRLRQHGEDVLQISVGPHRDGRFDSVGDWVKHIFSAEIRYVERLSGRPLTDPASIPNDNIEALFEFGQRSRKELEQLLETFPASEWDVPKEFKILTYRVRATPRKVITHTLLHEIRHWAQIATLLRLSGVVDEFHDFLASPVMGGEWGREEEHS